MKELCNNCKHKNNWIGCFECDGEFYKPKMKKHELKILPQYFNAVADGSKTFEIRENDRDYQVGDKLVLEEWECLERGYTGNEITKGIKYKITHEEFPQGIQEGYCVLGLEDIKPKQQFQLGDTAYMIDEDYRYFESIVNRIDLDKGECFYTTNDADFGHKDIGDWVFTSELYREMHMENLFGREEK